MFHPVPHVSMKIPDLLDIAQSWARAANPTPEQARIAALRLATCDTCEHKQWGSIILTFKCNACGCPLNKKVYSTKPGAEACPKGKWEE